MRAVVMTVSIALAGCASTMTAETALNESDWDICASTMGGKNSQVATVEAQRRSLDCRPMYPAILAKQQQEAEARFRMGAAMRALGQSYQAPMMVAPAASTPSFSMRCRSQQVGVQTITNCN
jgi:hypothetical protein